MTTLYFAAFLLAFAASLGATPFSIWLAKRCGVLDHPNARKVHATPIPRWGGLGIYLGILVGVLRLWAGFPHFRIRTQCRMSIIIRRNRLSYTLASRQDGK